jgi:two-component system sensor histidine kinase HydH
VDPDVPPSSEIERTGFDELRHRTFLRVFERLLQVRRTLGPVLLCLALWVGLSDTETWRRMTIFVIVGLLCALITVDIRHGVMARGDGQQGPPLVPTLFGVAIVQHTLIFVSGGIASPVVPLILPLVFLTGLLTPSRASLIMGGFHLVAVWLWVWIDLAGLIDLTPTVFVAAGSRSPVLTLSLAIVMTLALTITTIMSRTAAAALWRMIGEALESRDAALASRAEQARTLTTLSGEIAHELKNPLATVKGLAALIERSELPEKSAERMQVLRREVNRMQEILEEFLNFSRPLVPLDLREIELRELVDHVVDLHEGMAAERRVTLRAAGQARLRCDPRKIEQVLLNLVQNSLEVAPAGSSIEIDLRSLDLPAMGAEVSVRDAGPGIAEELRGRVFEAGVTGKAEGSGLGLTIARALARQHGGELELRDRHDGARGCEAIVTLPKQIVETTTHA